MDHEALRIAIHAMSYDELEHAAKEARRKSRLAQGMADRYEREIRRRKREARKARYEPQPAEEGL